MGAIFIKDLQNNLREVSYFMSQEKEKQWEPNADMVWGKSVCENDVQAGFTYKVLQMINNTTISTDIEIPSGGAVKTSDGEYYTSNIKHIWNDTNAHQSEVGNYKLRWLIYYYTTETSTINLLNNVMYACFDGVKFGKIFGSNYSLQYFDIINGANLLYTVTSASSMFFRCYSLQALPLFNTSNVTTMNQMFSNCYSLQALPLFNTSNVTTMNQMFNSCYSLQAVPLFDTNNVTDTGLMFNSCYSLQAVPLFDTNNVTDTGLMFNSCYSLQAVPLFNTSNVTRMSQMFNNCYSLQAVPLFNTSNVTRMNQMFINDINLQVIPEFNANKVTDMTNIFNTCSKLEYIKMENIGVNLSISSSTKYSAETLVEVISNLKDLTGLTAQTLTMGTTNLAKLTPVQIEVATNKNWSVA